MKNLSSKPYIGITDFMSREQTSDMLSFFENQIQKSDKTINHKLMVGVVSLYETLNDLPSEWTNSVPKNQDISSIFIDHPLLLNTVHYVDFRGRDILENLIKITKLGGKNLSAIQFDMVWPDPLIIKRYRELFPHIQTVLQINTPALNNLKDQQNDLIDKIQTYDDSIDFIILDKSMGRGISLDCNFFEPIIKRINDELPKVAVAIAGGLGPDTINLAASLLAEFPNLSIDAEAKLRPSGDSHDPIDWSLAKKYLNKALTLFYTN